MPEVITTHTTVYALDELSPEARAKAVEDFAAKLGGEWWDSHDAERVSETIVYDLAARLEAPGWDRWGVGDFPGIDGVKLTGWDIERGQSVMFDGRLTRANAPALPWVEGIDAIELDAKRDYTSVSVEESEPVCTCTGDVSWLAPHLDDCPSNVPNPSTPEQHRTLVEAVKDAMHGAWKAGRDEGEYISSEENAVQCIEANEHRFLEDGSLY
jgi:hypothetical protein